MINVKSLVQHVNPVPDPPTNGMSARARDELAELIGSDLVEAVETKRRGPARRPSRRGSSWQPSPVRPPRWSRESPSSP